MPLQFNTDRYIASLRRRVDAMRQGAQQAVAKAAGEAFSGIVERTPIDTGRARASWQLRPINPWTWLIISEGVPYILILEFGGYRSVGPKTVATGTGIFSRQAPQGMVRITLMDIREQFRAELGDALQTSWRVA